MTKFKIKYVPGELKAITFNLNGKKMNEYSLKTAQKSTKITLINENQVCINDGDKKIIVCLEDYIRHDISNYMKSMIE